MYQIIKDCELPVQGIKKTRSKMGLIKLTFRPETECHQPRRLEQDLQFRCQIQPENILLKSLSFLLLASSRLNDVTGAMKILTSSKSLIFLSFAFNFLDEDMPTGDGLVYFDGFQRIRFLNMSFANLTGEIPDFR
uniref:T4.16 protein n=1 Tax=Malus x robusta TaxID=1184610 RepID=I7IG72_9ROSA|nr:T4.16 [Malus x robusta]